MASFDRRAGLWPHVFVVLVAVLCAPLTAHAWLEQVVSGHETRVSLDANGSLLARHQLTLSLRGGPLSKVEIEGIGEDIEILSDAKVTRIKNTSGPGIPLRVTQTEGGALRLEVLGVDGLRSGTYRFEFAYRLDATQRKLLEVSRDRAVLTWVGPRLQGGVDSAKVVVSIPHAEQPPALPSSGDRAARGVLLGQVLQGSVADEIELLRAHVAVGEPAVWQVEFDRSALSGSLASDPLAPPALTEGHELAPRRGPGPWQLGLSLLACALITLLVVLKERAVRILAQRTDSRPRPLVPGPPWLRGGVAGLAAAGFVALTLLHRATLAMGCGLLLALLVVHFPPVRKVSPRGPGTWIPLPGAGLRPRWPLLVRLYEPSTIPGFFLALALLLFGGAVAFTRLAHDSSQSLLALSFVLLASPLFLTGRSSDFPRSPAEQALPWFRFLSRARLGTLRALELWGRKTDKELVLGPIDEVRIRLLLQRPPSGLRALEVAFEEGPGNYVSPCLVLRVVDDSPAFGALPVGIAWSRGRHSEEKTAVLHPAAPTRAQLLSLVRSVLAHLHQGSGGARTSAAGAATQARSERSAVRIGPLSSPA